MVPKDRGLREAILEEAHSSKLSIHPGSNKMYQDLRPKFWWTKMKKEITIYVARCDTYRKVKADHLRPTSPLQPLSIWVIVDRFTKLAHFLPIRNNYRAHHYAELYLE